MFRLKRIVVKVGTHAITSDQGLLNTRAMKKLVEQVTTLVKEKVEVVLVSSGSVGAGRSMLKLSRNNNKIMQRQAYSSVGQIKLMNSYTNLFQKHEMFCAQVLATKGDFRDRSHYLNMKNCLQTLFKNNIVPIVNENDVVAVSELMFTDNDELAGLIAAMINADALFILTHVDGVYDSDPQSPDSLLLDEIYPEEKPNIQYSVNSKSLFGRGGIHTKLRVAQKAAKMGIRTWILNGKKNNIILDTMHGKQNGTMLHPHKDISNVKKWISYSDGSEKGKVVINEGAERVLVSNDKISSLLPVGIINIEGDFEKGDIIKVVNAKNKNIGMGIAQYNSQLAKDRMGEKGNKPLIHYDYLFIGQ